MKFLLDTCVISEIAKSNPNKNVITWLKNQDESKLFLSVLTFGEIQKGIEKAPDEIRKEKLKLWVEEDLKQRFEGRIFPLDLEIATQWSIAQGISEKAGKPMPAIDGLIAISGLVNNCTVVTRNTSDMEQSKVELLDLWN
jgi:predicted nucleic acid-binding protein